MNKKNNERINYWTRAAMIGAIYALLTILFAPISYTPIQVRISEMLMILPYFTPAAIPGLFVGCFIANIFGGWGILDIVFGSLATLISAYLVSKINNRYLVPMPPVIINALVVGGVLYVLQDRKISFHLIALYVGLGQLIACYGLGFPLLLLLERNRHIFD